MIARIAALALLSSASAGTLTVTCTTPVAPATVPTAATTGFGLVRVGNAAPYTDTEFSCLFTPGTPATNAASVNGATSTGASFTVTYQTGQQFVVINRADLQLAGVAGTTAATIAANACGGASAARYCEVQNAPDTYSVAAAVNAQDVDYWFFDCSGVTLPQTIAASSTMFAMGTTPATANQFQCTRGANTAPTAVLTSGTPYATAASITVFPDGLAAQMTYFQFISGGGQFQGITQRFGQTVTPASAPCVGSTSTCIVTDAEKVTNTPSSFDFDVVGGSSVVPQQNTQCTFTCTTFGGSSPGTACASASTTLTTGQCTSGSQVVVTQACASGSSQGQITCVPSGVNIGQGSIASLLALIAAGPNPRTSFNQFVNVLQAQGYGLAIAATCGPCVQNNINGGNGGFVVCANCNVLTGVNRRQAVVPNGVAVVVCPLNGQVAQTDCLRAAACNNAFAPGASCSVGGNGIACPTCNTVPLFDRNDDGSKKGLLGLLGLLALIPLCLLLLSSCLLCLLLLRRKKRAVLVPPPVMPTVAPMTSVCEPAVVCGGTAGYPGMCSPYGSAYPCV